MTSQLLASFGLLSNPDSKRPYYTSPCGHADIYIFKYPEWESDRVTDRIGTIV